MQTIVMMKEDAGHRDDDDKGDGDDHEDDDKHDDSDDNYRRSILCITNAAS